MLVVWAMSIRACADFKRNMVSCGLPILAYVKLRFWVRRSGWQCAAYVRSPRSNIWTMCYLHYSSCQMTLRPCIGVHGEVRKHPLLSALVVIAWKACGTLVLLWQGASNFFGGWVCL